MAIAAESTSSNQRFDITPRSDYTYTISAKCASDGKILTVPHAETENNVAVWTPQGELNDNQAWYFEDTSIAPTTQIEDGGIYQLRARHMFLVFLCSPILKNKKVALKLGATF